MKKFLLTNKKNYYKANLHCHSTISDGTKSPEELKKMYFEHGYSIIAFTDHDVFIPHNDLTDDNFLALNGYELQINKDNSQKTCHLCFIALDNDNFTQVCYHRSLYFSSYTAKYKDEVKFDESKPDFVREYSPECINTMISKGRKSGFFVTYNHPSWSLENLNDYGNYHNMNAMEICNYGCFVEGYTDYNEKEYDEMLRGGERIFCIAADDNHNYGNDSFGGFTVINSDKLEYKEITNALSKGNFYASQGPEIYNLSYEDGKIEMECSPCAKIVLNTDVRAAKVVYAQSNEEPITKAVFDIGEYINEYKYIRLTVTDFSGKHANTNAYFTDEL